MSTLKKLIVISSVMFACANLFAEQVLGTGTPWGVRGISTATSNYGYLGHDYYGAFGVDNSTGNYGGLGSDFYGAFGIHGSGNKGYLGSMNYGAYGENDSTNNYGYLGSDSYGVYGESSAGNYGYIGSSSYGAYGRSSGGNYGILGYTSYGVYGRHSSGNYGFLGSSSYGAYGRNTSGNYAYLGTSAEALKAYAATTSSYSANLTHTSGSYAILAGNLWGAHIKGPNSAEVYIGTSTGTGLTASGTEWAGNFYNHVLIQGNLYVSGDKDNIIKLDDGTWVTMSATEAPYPEYTISGRATLSNGTARIEFEEPYPALISQEIPIKVIVTSEGSYSGIYVKDVTASGFTAVSEVGDRNATFNWMAIARVKGKEQKTDYEALTAKMQRLEASQKELGIGFQSLKPSVNSEESDESQILEMLPELSLSAPELNAAGNVTIGYQLPKASNVNLSVYDASGRLVKILVSSQRNAGNHSIVWNSTDESDREVSAGVYYVRLDDGTSLETAKVTIVK